MPGVVTIVFTDLVGSTELLQRLGDDVMEVTRREHFATLRECVAAHGGEEVKSVGDGVMAVFGSTVEAVASAIRIQQEVDRKVGVETLQVRIGLHVGEPIVEDGDYYGTTVVVAKRLCDVAQGGQILASHLVKGLVGSRAGLRFRDLDSMDLKGLDEPVAVTEVVWEPDRKASLPLPAPMVRRDLTPFVGREMEIDTLRVAAKTAEEGRPRLATIGGEPGIGKTRLAAEFVASMHETGWTVLFGRSDEQALTPYQPFVEALGTWAEETGSDVARAAAAGYESELARLIPAFGDPGGGADADRYRLFEAVSALLSEVSRSSPVVFVLDDLHWADQPSLLLLRHLLRTTRPSPILYVGTYRETELGRTHPLAQALADLRRETQLERVSLRGLTPDQVTDLLSAAAGHDVGERGRRLAEQMWHSTEGNPFFIESIVRHLVDSGRIYLRDGVWTYDDDVTELGIPEGVKEVIGQRLSRLGAEANEILRGAAVLGRDFSFEVLVRVAQRPTDQVLEALDDAIAAQLVAEVPAEATPTYSFTHALIRQTLYEELHLARKQRMHLRAGEATEEVFARDLDPHLPSLAVHYRLAGAAADPDRAISFSVRAGVRALSLFAYEEAAAHWEAALELTEDDGRDASESTRLRERIGDLLFLSGIDYDRSEEHMTRALTDYESRGDEHRAAQVHSKLARNLSTFPSRMDIPRAMSHFEAARPLIESSGGPPHIHLKLAMANAYLWGMRNPEGADAASEVMELADAAGNASARCLARALFGWFRFSMGHLREGIGAIEHAWEEANDLDRTFLAFSAAWMRATVGQMLSDPDDCLRWAHRELKKPRMAEAPILREQLMANVVWVSYFRGERLDLTDLGHDLDELLLGAQLTGILDGHVEEIAAEWVDVAETVRGTGNALMFGGVRFSQSQAATWRGRYREAERLMRESLAAHDEGRSSVVGSLAQCWLAVQRSMVGDAAGAQEALDGAAAVMTPDEDWRGNGGWLRLARAMVHVARGNVHEAEPHFREAIELMERYGLRPSVAFAHLKWGEALIAAGRTEAGNEQLDRAEDVHRSYGAGEFWLETVRAARPPR